ncbi:SDR family oxidoreductase [Pigmentiphaga sp.]|uniref:SDR family NAD(P)-dependent oxidoreductase n=1 Tax=Pigmentiphaga sp. TaxID=1977564 RepID=UPI0025E2CC75|nr:SDR family oxidoreductase [Pigmentiphaga sp.]
MDLGLEGKTVMVTGGSFGIGLACARAFVDEGAKVAILGRRPEALEQARSRIAGGGDVVAVSADLCRESEAERAVVAVETLIGPVDVLVNCAGAAARSDYTKLDETAWRDGFESKFMPYINMCTVLLRRFHARRDGNPGENAGLAIVNVIGKGGRAPTSTHLPGGAANAALMLATAGLAQAWGKHGVRINAVNPASIATERLTRRFAVAVDGAWRTDEERMRASAGEIPLGRFGEPSEVADVVLFLASKRASYVLGSGVAMDGGLRPLL